MNDTTIAPHNTKQDKLLPGLRRLCDRRLPGQTFSAEELARECGVDIKSIRWAEQRALHALMSRLLETDRALLQQLFSSAKVEEITERMQGGRLQLYTKPGRPKASRVIEINPYIRPLTREELNK